MISNFTADEEEILASYERGEWKSVDKLQEEMSAYRQAAANWIKKHHTIILTLPENDFEQFQQKLLTTGKSSEAVLTNLIKQFIAS